MKLYSRYLGVFYLKYFLILFIALEGFYIGVDILISSKDFPDSANLGLLYIGFTAIIAINYTIMISLIFAMILTIINFIRSNELISFYSLGISKFSIIKTPFLISLIITFFYIYLNTTPLVYANEYKKNIENLNLINKVSNDFFLKHQNKYIYIKNLNSLTNTANDIKIFYLDQQNLNQIANIKKANYDDKKWVFFDANITKIPANLNLGADGLEYESVEKFEDLQKLHPAIIEKIYNSSNIYSINDAIKSIKAFQDQGININNIKANLYSLIFTPFFAPFMILIIFYYMPTTGRFFNLAIASFIFFISTLCIWGALFVLTRFSITGVISPEIGIILPILFLMIFAIYLNLKTH
ncbi:LptF/LptG family permease [Campylobacter sp. FMV-PI01]|uniref:LptF/LptG family permease n=1 Tax=Campylobacter portucalensis TaxID=2608384 RepID=A0A6L5WF93_9BACT|nr:LptF/LptG family permease [Campylobacter portucalensis]MSN95660.1 LptF/LptG family permease [Campylobacter portucalensis]